MPRRYLEKDILPHIGSKPVEISPPRTCAASSGQKGARLRRRCWSVRGLLKRMFDYAPDLRPDPGQPGHGLADAARLPRRRPRPGADMDEIPAVSACHTDLQHPPPVQDRLPVDHSDPGAQSPRLMLAQWTGHASGRRRWHIPVENSKTGKAAHRLPVRRRRRCSKELKPLASSSVWVLPGRGTLAKSFANNALNQALKVSLRGQGSCLHHP